MHTHTHTNARPTMGWNGMKSTHSIHRRQEPILATQCSEARRKRRKWEGVTDLRMDGWTDRRTARGTDGWMDRPSYRGASEHLKMRSGNENDNEGWKTRKEKETMGFGWFRGGVTPVVSLGRGFCGFSGKFNMTSWTCFDDRRYVLNHLCCIGCPNEYGIQSILNLPIIIRP